VVVFEREPRAGGHAHTHTVPGPDGAVALDTGFLVYNHRTYPHFVRLLEELGVEGQDCDMSFGVRCRRCGLEYSTRGPRGFFAQPRRALDPRHLEMLLDLPRFHRRARAFLADPLAGLTLGQFLDEGAYSPAFVRHHLLPMGAAIWSSPSADVRRFSARTFLQFFASHGWLETAGATRWRTIRGGSRTYVEAITRQLDDVRLGCGVARVERRPDGVRVETMDGRAERFDAVVLATHADVTRRLLADADPEETRALLLFRYSSNRVVLHTDRSALPEREAARASWSCDLDDCADEVAPVSLTYDLNRLQSIPGPTRYCATLNPVRPLEGVIAALRYEHPVLDLQAERGQALLARLNGRRSTWFAGAHLRHGFHEDGLLSALEVARGIRLRAAAGSGSERRHGPRPQAEGGVHRVPPLSRI
jgi:predicted NAD/FAD-binding protein